MRTNRKSLSPRTHEGAVAARISPRQQLRRSLMSCLLWEDNFYEDGVEIAGRLHNLASVVEPQKVASMMIEARQKLNLRHAPLLLACALAKKKALKSGDLAAIIQRPDELTEFLSIYSLGRKGAKKLNNLSNQAKKGLAKAFCRFDAYQLGKYNRKEAIKLKDVLFLCHAKPKDAEQEKVWKKLIDGTLESPDTWEVNLSAGKDKKQTWERLLSEEKLGAMALLRNLRNMEQEGVSRALIADSLARMNTRKVFPYRFISAAKATPSFEPELEKALFKCKETVFRGLTIVVVDCSGSMGAPLSEKSIMTRFDAAAGIAMICREVCEQSRVFAYGTDTKEVAPRHGFALRDALRSSNVGYSTFLGDCIRHIDGEIAEYDRILVFTDEQSHDNVPEPRGKGYVINVAPHKNGVGYGKWIHIDGFSEFVLKYIQEYESLATE